MLIAIDNYVESKDSSGMEPKFYESQEIPSTLNGNLDNSESLRGTSQNGGVVIKSWDL